MDKIVHVPQPCLLAYCTLYTAFEMASSLWPAYGTLLNMISGNGFVDPFQEDYNDYFDVLPDGRLKPLKDPATYMINNLYLNRTGAKRIRENRRLKYENQQSYKIYAVEAI